MKSHIRFLTAFCLIVFSVETQATIRYVRPISYGSGNGSSWANASNDLQLMINNSAAGDSVFVAQGTYYPIHDPSDDGFVHNVNSIRGKTTDRDNSFVLKEDVKIFGGFADNGTATWKNRNWNTYPSVLSGDIGVPNDNADNCYHVVISVGYVGTACLDGFRVTKGGYSDSGLHITVNNISLAQYIGGGVYIASSSPSLKNLIIDSNSNVIGSGIYCMSSSITLTNVIINGNDDFNSISFGAMITIASSVVLTNVLVVKNQGNAIFSNISSFILTNVTISENSGGISSGTQDSFQIRNSIIWGNTRNSPYYNVIYTHSLVGGEPIGNGIISNSDPLFIDAANGNYRLMPNSPAIDIGNNAVYSSDSIPNLSAINKDLDGNPRFYNTTVDLGAYEFRKPFIIVPKDTRICQGDSIDIPIILEGVVPWHLIYTKDNGISYDTIKNITDTVYYLKLYPLFTTTYKFIEVEDYYNTSLLVDSIQIKVLPMPVFTNSFFNDTLCNNETTKLVAFSGTGNNYEWTSAGNISGIPAASTGNFGEYLAKNNDTVPLTNTITITPKYTESGKSCVGNDTSFSITVLPEPIIITQLKNDTLCDNEQTQGIKFEGIATNYEWTVNEGISGIPTTGTGNFGNHTVTNKTTDRIKSLVKVTPKYELGSKECTGTDQSFEVVVRPTTKIDSIDVNTQFVCEGDELKIGINATGENLVYQWYKDNNLLLGETNRNFIVSSVTQSHNGTYNVEVIGICGTETSQKINIDASGANVLVEKWHDVILADNSSRQFVAYQWYKDGRIIDGATEQFYQEVGGLNGCYSVELRLAAGSVMRSCERCAYKTVKSNEIHVYPNPTSNQLRITNCELRENADIQIFDIVGRLLQSKIVNLQSEIVLDISHLSAGLYFLKIDNTVVKIIKN